jgi:hypothetical protein
VLLCCCIFRNTQAQNHCHDALIKPVIVDFICSSVRREVCQKEVSPLPISWKEGFPRAGCESSPLPSGLARYNRDEKFRARTSPI